MRTFTRQDSLCVKAIAVCAMMFYHLFFSAAPYGQPVSYHPFSSDLVITLAVCLCEACVGTFVFLSAYGLTVQYGLAAARAEHGGAGALSAQDAARFTGRRLVRLMTGFWFVFALCELAALLLRAWPDGVYGASPAFAFTADALGLAYFFNTPTLCGAWWYMTVALVQIVTAPLLIRWCRRDGWLVCAVLLLVPGLLGLEYIYALPRFAATAALGTVCAQREVPARLCAWRPFGGRDGGGKGAAASKALRCALSLAALCACAAFRIVYKKPYLIDGPLALALVWFYMEWLSPLRVLRAVLAFLGRHSMNMYLMHQLLLALFLPRLVYGARNFVLVFCVLLALSLAASLAAEGLKKLLRYDRFSAFLAQRAGGEAPAGT